LCETFQSYAHISHCPLTLNDKLPTPETIYIATISNIPEHILPTTRKYEKQSSVTYSKNCTKVFGSMWS